MTVKHDLFIATFPYGRHQDPDTAEWITKLRMQLKDDERIGRISFASIDDTPITMTHNLAMKTAKVNGFDLCLMVDSDMAPDAYLAERLTAKPFFNSSLEFMLDHRGPCMVAAPYCGPSPDQLCYMFEWQRKQPGRLDVFSKLEMIPREAAAQRSGIWEVAAAPTGLLLIDMRVCDVIKPPYFDYEYADEEQSVKATTEDVYFTRNASLAGVPVYSNWDAWAGHWKWQKVGPPCPLTPDAVRDQFRDAVRDNNRLKSNQTLIFLRGFANGDRRGGPTSPGPIRNGEAALERPGGRDLNDPDKLSGTNATFPTTRAIVSDAGGAFGLLFEDGTTGTFTLLAGVLYPYSITQVSAAAQNDLHGLY